MWRCHRFYYAAGCSVVCSLFATGNAVDGTTSIGQPLINFLLQLSRRPLAELAEHGLIAVRREHCAELASEASAARGRAWHSRACRSEQLHLLIAADTGAALKHPIQFQQLPTDGDSPILGAPSFWAAPHGAGPVRRWPIQSPRRWGLSSS